MTLATSLVIVVAYRAAHQSITHDEAFTYLAFLSGRPSLGFTSYTGNNHVFFSAIARLSLGLLVFWFPLRLPSVSLPWCISSSIGLCRLVFGATPLFLATVAALVLNPYVLDFFVAARGYGMALALFFLGFHLTIRVLLASRPAFDRGWLMASLACALSVCANLRFLVPAASLLYTAIGIDVVRRIRNQCLSHTITFAMRASGSCFLPCPASAQ